MNPLKKLNTDYVLVLFAPICQLPTPTIPSFSPRRPNGNRLETQAPVWPYLLAGHYMLMEAEKRRFKQFVRKMDGEAWLVETATTLCAACTPQPASRPP